MLLLTIMIISGTRRSHSLPTSKFRRIISLIVGQLDSLLLWIFPNRKNRTLSTGFFGLNYKCNLRFIEADIVHLHWVNGLVSTRSVRGINKPVVWSIREMWPITGGCRYSLDCEKYKTGCGKCPQLNSGLGIDFTNLTAKMKKKYFRKVNSVGISEWVTSEANKSFIFGDGRAVTINNNVDCSLFFPIEKILLGRFWVFIQKIK